jgi:hypothetical protein
MRSNGHVRFTLKRNDYRQVKRLLLQTSMGFFLKNIQPNECHSKRTKKNAKAKALAFLSRRFSMTDYAVING